VDPTETTTDSGPVSKEGPTKAPSHGTSATTDCASLLADIDPVFYIFPYTAKQTEKKKKT
jgi:hypothetical protein